MSPWTDDRPVRTPELSAKQEILARLRTALDSPRRDAVTEAADVPRRYQRADGKQETTTDPAKIRDVLVSRLEDYTATVHRTTADQLATTIATAAAGCEQVLVPAAVPPSWTEQIAGQVRQDEPGITPRQLDRVDAVVTGCHTAIAMTGTLVLRSDDRSGRRALTLVPDHHIVVVEADQVVLGVPKAIERMQEQPDAAWTWVSGPSATSDIELERVEGVHGPRRLQIILVDPDPATPDPSPPEQTRSEGAA